MQRRKFSKRQILTLLVIAVLFFGGTVFSGLFSSKPEKGKLESVSYRAYGDMTGSYTYLHLSVDREGDVVLKTSIASSAKERKVETKYICTIEDFEAVEEFMIENGLLRKTKITPLPTLTLDKPVITIAIELEGRQYAIFEGQTAPIHYRKRIPALADALGALAKTENIMEEAAD